ncbi:Hypothetical protein (plasmid) [Pseudomonas putida]|nr:Hypothetical protein [Pseudomonas putida]
MRHQVRNCGQCRSAKKTLQPLSRKEIDACFPSVMAYQWQDPEG